MNPEQFLTRIQRHAEYQGQIVHVEPIPARAAIYGELDVALPPRLIAALAEQGVRQLYRHQTEAIDLARLGYHLIITTATASGKSLCYNAPVLETLLTDPDARALYLFPTKALAQDQQAKLNALVTSRQTAIDKKPENTERAYSLGDTTQYPVHIATYDGDTPKDERSWVKRNARLVITNPDMLHLGILPYHSGWMNFFRHLRYVVVDEAHVYRGVFGAHVANILRRLRRVAARWNSRPQFIACSATIANPEELFQRLTGLRAEVVNGNGAPVGKRHFVFWNPPVFDKKSGARKSANSEATLLFTSLVGEGVRTIAFTRARKTAELLLTYSRRQFESTLTKAHLSKRIISYRAGYTPEQRREIERRLFNGELTGVTATNALELGVDIGGVDACIMTGYPGTIASAWQQAGRAGRRQGEALAVLVAADNPLDQFLMRRPDYFFGSSHEHAALDPTNRHILSGHLLCAAHELPLEEGDYPLFGSSIENGVERVRSVANRLVEDGRLAARGNRFVYLDPEYPASRVGIRSASSHQYTILDRRAGNRVLGTVEEGRAFEMLHHGAVYMHLGETFLVEELDTENRRAFVIPATVNFYTETTSLGSTDIKETRASKEFGNVVAYFGSVVVTNRITGYRQKRLFSDEVVESFVLEMPEQQFETEAVWYGLPLELVEELREKSLDLAGGVHAVEHASIGLLPLFALCDRNDIGGVSTPYHPQVGSPAIFVHDAHPGGVGIAEAGYRLIDGWLKATRTLLEDCPCESGCPSCVQSPKCGNNNEPLDKDAARFILQYILRPEGEKAGKNT